MRQHLGDAPPGSTGARGRAVQIGELGARLRRKCRLARQLTILRQVAVGSSDQKGRSCRERGRIGRADQGRASGGGERRLARQMTILRQVAVGSSE